MEPLSTVARAWLREAFGAPTAVQARGWEAIARGQHALLIAPTGSGKTLAAFLYCLDRLALAPKSERGGVRVLYVSPLKALAFDVDRNLRAPLAGLSDHARRQGITLELPRVAVRTGDTSAKERRAQLREPAEVLVTTPESLYLLLGSRARQALRSVDTVIIDEAHALAPTKRGAHLALSLERLAALTGREPQRIGLSATASPLAEVARYVGGEREVTIVDASGPPRLALAIEGAQLGASAGTAAGSVWDALVPRLVGLVREHTSTIVFVNSRGLCERLARQLNDEAGEPLVTAHHGSLAQDERRAMEERLKRGELRGIVATSSLELGIDMGAVDLVVMVESPGSVARGLQRAGRAGHAVGEVSVARILPKHPRELLEAAVIGERMRAGAIEALHVPEQPLDVLAQHIVAMVAVEPTTVSALLALVRRSASYRALSARTLHGVLDMLAGRYPSTSFAELRPRLVWDREHDVLRARQGSAMLALVNGGTIPDRGLYAVHVGERGPRVGELDEEMVYETQPGEVFTLGASSFRVEQVTRDRVVVSPAPGELGKLPFWRGEGPGRPIELGRALGAFLRELSELDAKHARAWLLERYALDERAADSLIAYVQAQRAITGTLPTDRAITVEAYRDEVGDYRVTVLSPFGARVHAPLALAIAGKLGLARGAELQTTHGDDGIVLRFAGAEGASIDAVDAALATLLPRADEVDALVEAELAGTALFAGAFRENAARALLLPRRRAGARTPLWLQRKRAADLLASARQFPDFPIVLETYRSCLRDTFDMPALRELLEAIERRELRVDVVHGERASPFSQSLTRDYVSENLYAGDRALAERRARLLTVDAELLRELLGEAALRDLLDPDVLRELHDELQALHSERKARSVDAMHDLLRRLGELDERELAARCELPEPLRVDDALAQLRMEKRALRLPIAGRERHVAIEDAALYRDALGVSLPAGVPAALLVPKAEPLLQLLRRYARTRTPFALSELSARYGLPEEPMRALLLPLVEQGVLAAGALRPGGQGAEYCDADVLRRLRRRSHQRLRARARPVPVRVLARFLPVWAGLDAPREGLEGLRAAIAQLQGLPLPFRDLERAILPARVKGYAPSLLDQLGATGVVCFVGRGTLGAGDGRVCLYLRSRVATLLDVASLPEPPAPGTLEHAICEHLAVRGASFFPELLEHGLGESSDALFAALQGLLWSGLVTNDSFAPLRAGPPVKTKSPRIRSAARARAAAGRFSLTRDLVRGAARDALARDASAETRARASSAHESAKLLLERHGVIAREHAQLEELPGGMAVLLPVIDAMEAAGELERGYFVEGLGGMQAALPGAVERLRACAQERDDRVRVLAATDPANAFGWALPWPGAGPARRAAGAVVVLAGERAVLFVSRGGKHVLTLDPLPSEASWAALVTALRGYARTLRGKVLRVEQIDGAPAQQTALARVLVAHGFRETYRGLELE